MKFNQNENCKNIVQCPFKLDSASSGSLVSTTPWASLRHSLARFVGHSHSARDRGFLRSEPVLRLTKA